MARYSTAKWHRAIVRATDRDGPLIVLMIVIIITAHLERQIGPITRQVGRSKQTATIRVARVARKRL